MAPGRLGRDHRQPQAIASSVTLPNASVIDGIEEQVGAGERAGEIVAGQLAGEDRVGQLLLEPRPRRAFADHQHAVLEPALGEGVDRVGKDVEALFHHDPAEEGDDHFVVGDADRRGATPCRAGRG